MNLTNLIFWSLSIITFLAGLQSIDVIQRGIWKAQAKVVYESRTETWGSPKAFRVLSASSYRALEHRKSRPRSQ